MSKYDDIIHMPRHVSPTRAPMPMASRAAQFAPFAALTGHDAAIRETARLTHDKTELSDDEHKTLSEMMGILMSHAAERPAVTFTVYEPDARKSGGRYIRISGIIKKIDEYDRTVILENDTIIKMDDILAIESNVIDDIY